MNAIKHKRKKIGISVKRISALLNITPKEYKRMECDLNNANAFLLYKTCSLLGLDFDTFSDKYKEGYQYKYRGLKFSVEKIQGRRVYIRFVGNWLNGKGDFFEFGSGVDKASVPMVLKEHAL